MSERKTTEVTYIPALCSGCGKQLALIAVAPLMKGQRIIITVDPASHNCPGSKVKVQVNNAKGQA